MSDLQFLPDLARAAVARHPDAPALVMDDTLLSWREFDALCTRIAGALQRDGVLPGDRICICAGTSIAYASLFIAALRAGACVAPLAPSSTPEQLVAMIADSGAPLFFTDGAVWATLADHAGAIGPRRIALDDDTDAGEAWSKWLVDAPSAKPVALSPEMEFNIIYSSGTTGVPKGIVHTHAMRWMQLYGAQLTGYDDATVALLSTPLYSNTTLVSFLPAIAWGGTAVLMRKFDAGEFLRVAALRRVTHAMLVPVQYRRIMAREDFAQHDLSAFRMKFATSAPFDAGLKADVLARWPGGLIEYYGMTEGGGSCALVAHEHPDKLHTVGQPFPGHDIRLIDEDGREVATGEVGEIVGHSAAIMAGYNNRPDLTDAALWTAPDGRRFVRTGDMGRFDADGFLQLMDRKKDMIISGGFNIYPSDLEAVLGAHDSVAECAVVGVPSVEWGETPIGYVVLRACTDPEEIRQWANMRLGKTQRLAQVIALRELPRSAIGKVLKRELRDGYTARTVGR